MPPNVVAIRFRPSGIVLARAAFSPLSKLLPRAIQREAFVWLGLNAKRRGSQMQDSRREVFVGVGGWMWRAEAGGPI